jgi:chemotaxis receptor (MCP) glutamine deamidase CheD
VFPVGDTLKRKFLPLCGKSEKDSAKIKLKNKTIIVIASETSDRQGRCIFAILFRTIGYNITQKCF